MHRLIRLLSLWHGRMTARRTLATIDERSLRDAGIDPGCAGYETAQPFWRPLLPLRDPPVAAPPAAPVANDCGPALAARPRRAIASSGQ